MRHKYKVGTHFYCNVKNHACPVKFIWLIISEVHLENKWGKQGYRYVGYSKELIKEGFDGFVLDPNGIHQEFVIDHDDVGIWAL